MRALCATRCFGAALVSLAWFGCSGTASAPLASQIAITGKLIAVTPDSSLSGAGSTPTPVCADFSLRAYQLDIEGHRTFLGAPIAFSTVGDGKPILAACDDNGGAAGSANWGYVATVSHFLGCDSDGSAPAPVSPSILTADLPVHCQSGAVTPLNFTLLVNVVENDEGYPALGSTGECKAADRSADALVHFGISTVEDFAGTTGFAITAVNSGSPLLFAGDVVEDGPAGPLDTVYFTGVADPSTSLVYQTLLGPCAAGDEYADNGHGECSTLTAGPTTTPRFAAFFAEQQAGFASAAIVDADGGSDNAVSLVSASAALVLTNSDDDAGTFMSGVAAQLVSSGNLTGIFVDRSARDRFWVTADSVSGPVYAALTLSGADWSIGAFAPLPDPARAACLGLYSSASGCFTPKSCD